MHIMWHRILKIGVTCPPYDPTMPSVASKMLADDAFPKDKCSETLVTTWPCPGCCLPCNLLLHPLRKAVSRRKRRFQQDGFDLDLSYLTDRILVMGFPSTGIEHLYRNPRYELRRFFETRHKGHYKVYNLACEPGRGYPSHVFEGRVERYPFRDHGVPSLEIMIEATNSAQRWLDADPQNVVAFHCKAGKGRAGLLACCMLLRSGAFDTADDAIAHYNKVRVTNLKGLTVASQINYVHLFERIWREKYGVVGSLGLVSAETAVRFGVPTQPTLRIEAVRISELEQREKLLGIGGHNHVARVGGCKLGRTQLVVQVHKGTQFDPIFLGEALQSTPSSYTFRFTTPIDVMGNFRVAVVRVRGGVKTRKGRTLFELWENTAFIDTSAREIAFGLDALDMKSKLRRKLQPQTQLHLSLASANEPTRGHVALVSEDEGDVSFGSVELTTASVVASQEAGSARL